MNEHNEADLDLLGDFDEEESARNRRKAPSAGTIAIFSVITVVVLSVIGFFAVKAMWPSPAKMAAEVAKEVRDASDAVTHTTKTKDGEIELVTSAELNSFAVKVKGVPNAPEDNEYQLYLSDTENGLRPSTLLGAKPNDTWFGVRDELNTTREIHVTVVAQGGQQRPPAQDVVSIEIPQDSGK
ncbi:anti-sigma factor domain-containing protein [Pseudoglutamicibacter cumminsii]|uniref:anti-sigma factor domain-containing protein n=1 Tax=Pseudoglutamicibacter cumminsii TaxID=156979 RepID=UPI0021A42699|nr:anti-sigma factor [Pseudoglutamicibacter cumminsii]MCT1685603.1 hypothetical protein [Pseudoglutamicibacter cumminsii]MDK7082334.1 hypothetical protein [Pseudoglutamicibacter cumminsii]